VAATSLGDLLAVAVELRTPKTFENDRSDWGGVIGEEEDNRLSCWHDRGYSSRKEDWQLIEGS